MAEAAAGHTSSTGILVDEVSHEGRKRGWRLHQSDPASMHMVMAQTHCVIKDMVDP